MKRFPFWIVTVHPPLPLNLAITIVPDIIAKILVPGLAGISIPLWKEDANLVGEFLFPKGELIFVLPGTGQIKLPLVDFEIFKDESICSKSELDEIFDVVSASEDKMG